MKIRLKGVARMLPLAIAAVAAFAGSADAADSKDPIKLAINEWTGQHVTTYLAGETLKRLGYKVEYVTAGYLPQIQGVMDGDITATLEIWEHTIQDNFDKAIKSGKGEDLGDLGIKTVEGWIYPDYMEKECPGLPDYKALNACAEKFATAETFPQGRLLDYPADWGPDNDKRVAALGLNFKTVYPGSDGASVAEYKAAVAAHKPIIMMFYSPHWLFAAEHPKWVKLPESTPECYTDPKVGPNPDATHDCGWPNGWVKKLGWVGLKDKWPGAYKMLKAFSITTEDQNEIALQVDQDHVPIEQAVSKWLDAHPKVWQSWKEAMN
ncbi:ABC transporter substrate-binding protein [Hansschlegelia plantiphila]|uniref:ABC transporter n=1 Tax=Hansschlegelia plantiphila TaxID=374655 RepID=A0A9W6MWP1_9HYPH|nr:ABC transporter substrate-binding protein [Hansschlegelia plantiphila]GLK69744.1 ABC transporter [Hansschlegelia plantiphila]